MSQNKSANSQCRYTHLVKSCYNNCAHAHQHALTIAYHTSVLSGYGWVMELLNGHPEHIRSELGVHKHVFLKLIEELRLMGYSNERDVTLEEKLAIFLYACVT